jgi:hypothetical protein
MATTPTTKPFKRGDSFALTCTFKSAGQPTALTGYSIRAHLRDSMGRLITELVAQIAADQVATPGRFFLTPADQAQTKTWPAPGNLSCDIEFTLGGSTQSTQTFLIPIERDVTV